MPNLNEMFDAVFYINLDRRTDRRASSEVQFDAHGIKAERFPGFDDRENPERGCFMSHREVARIAKSRGCGSVMVFEDDIRFSLDFEERLGHFSDVPEDWGCVYLGGWRMGDTIGKVMDDVRPEHVKDHCWRLVCEYCMHAYALRGEVLDWMAGVEYVGIVNDNLLLGRFYSGMFDSGWYGLMKEDEAEGFRKWGMVFQADQILKSDLDVFREGQNALGRGVQMHLLGDAAYKNGDYEKAFCLWVDGATRNHAQCARNVAWAFEAGIGVGRNQEKAKKWRDRHSRLLAEGT